MIPRWSLILGLAVLVPHRSSGEREFLTSKNSHCSDECRPSSDGKRICTPTIGSKPEWCSQNVTADYRGIPCRTGDCCGTHGKYDYNWCYTIDGTWGYCSPPVVHHAGIQHLDRHGRKCVNPCDIYPEKHKHYFSCLTEGDGWSYCSPLPGTTISGGACKGGSPCSGSFRGKTWCYTDDDANWDYCGVIDDADMDTTDYDDWQYTEGRRETLKDILFGSSITKFTVNDGRCPTDDSNDDAVATIMEVMYHGHRPSAPDNERQRRNALEVIKVFRLFESDEFLNPVASAGSSPDKVDLHVKEWVEEDGDRARTYQLKLADGGRVLASCVLKKPLADKEPRQIGICLYNSLRLSRNTRVIQRMVRRRYFVPRRG